MNQDKFTIQLDAKAENFAAVADSVRELGTALKSAAPDLDALKRALESLSGVARVSATLTETAKTASKLADEFLKIERATRDVRRGVTELDEELNGARITAGSLGDAMDRLRSDFVGIKDAAESAAMVVDRSAVSFRNSAEQLTALLGGARSAGLSLRGLGQEADIAGDRAERVGREAIAARGGLAQAARAGEIAASAMAELADEVNDASNALDDLKSKSLAADKGLQGSSESGDGMSLSMIGMAVALETVGDALSAVGESSVNVGAGVGDAGDEADGAGFKFNEMALAGVGAGVAMAGLAVAMEAAKAAIGFATQATAEYLTMTRQGQNDIAVFSFNVQELKNAIGESVTETGLFRDGFDGLIGAVDDLTVIIPPLVETLDNYYRVASLVWESTEGIRGAMDTVGYYINRTINPAAGLFHIYDALAPAAGLVNDEINRMGDELRETEQALENQITVIPDLTSVWADASAAISGAREATGTFAEQWNSLRDLLFGDSGEVEITPVASRGGGTSARDQDAEEQRAKALVQINELKDANLEAMARVAEIEENDRLKTLAGIELEKQARLDLIEETEAAREAAREAAAEAAEAQAEQEAALIEERKAEIASYTDFAKQGYADVTASLANSIATSELAFGKSSKGASKALGDSLISVGQAAKAAAVIKGIGDPATGFFPNPLGAAAMFVAGTAAVNLGRVFGGGKEDSIAAPRELPDAAPQTQSRTSNNYFNFPNSFVGNNDQLARTIASVMNQGRRNGVE
jgi:hypothetical protein